MSPQHCCCPWGSLGTWQGLQGDTWAHLLLQHHADRALLVQLLPELDHLPAQILGLLIFPDVRRADPLVFVLCPSPFRGGATEFLTWECGVRERGLWMLSLPSRHPGDATAQHSSMQERVSLGLCLGTDGLLPASPTPVLIPTALCQRDSHTVTPRALQPGHPSTRTATRSSPTPQMGGNTGKWDPNPSPPAR